MKRHGDVSLEPSTFKLIAQSARGRGAHAAVVDADGELSYAELADHARRYAHDIGAGTAPDARVVLFARNSRHYAAAMLGLEALGRVRVPLNFRATAVELATVLDDCTPQVVACDAHTESVVRAALAERDPARAPRIVRLDALDARRAGDDAVPLAPASSSIDALASISYTSGTLSRPKGVMLTGRQWQAVYRNLLSVRDLRSTDRLGLIGPLSHAAGAYLVPAWLTGATVVLLPSAAPADLAVWVERHRLTILQCVPTVLTRLVQSDVFRSADRSSLRLVIYGAERMPRPTLEGCFALFGPILAQNYGLTEAMMTGCTLQPHEHVAADGRLRVDTIGRPYPFVQLEIRRADGTQVAPGEIGEITIRSPHVMQGYWGRPDATSDALQDGWLRSGDLACWDDDGFVVIKGRAKDIVISGGTNLYPAEIDAWLQRYPEFAEVATFGVEDAIWGERLVAAVAPHSRTGSDALLTAFERARAALGLRCPKQWLAVTELPRSGSGKIDYRALRARAVPP